MANTNIQLRKSGVSGNVPASLNFGELALNYADGKLYYKNSSGLITYISSGATTNSFATINSNSSLVIATSNTDILSLAAANNIVINTNTGSKTITIGAKLTDSLTLGDPQVGASSNSVANLYSIVQGVQSVASTAGMESILAYNTANSATILAQKAYDTANSGISLAQSAYNYANTITSGPTINYISNNSIGLTGNTANQVIDTFSTTNWRTAKYLIQLVSGSDVHSTELFLTHDDTNVLITQYGEIYTNNIMTLDAVIVSGNLNLMVTPSVSSGYVDVVRTTLIARTIGDISGDLVSGSGTIDLLSDSGTTDLGL